MIRQHRNRLTGLALMAILFTMVLLGGCNNDEVQTPEENTSTALGGLETARSALSTTAPDAKLLVVQTAEATEPTATPAWVYLFGSPETGRTYAVYLVDGRSMGAEEYGSAGLTDAEWSQIPGTESWEVDSDDAYQRALEASGAEGSPAAYIMGLITFKPTTDTSTVQPFVWNVQFDPGASGASTATIEVNAETGATSIAE